MQEAEVSRGAKFSIVTLTASQLSISACGWELRARALAPTQRFFLGNWEECTEECKRIASCIHGHGWPSIM